MQGRVADKFGLRMAVFSLLLLFAANSSFGQSVHDEGAERTSVLSVVQAFFDTMATRDVEKARSILVADGSFHSIQLQDGKLVRRDFTNQSYLDDLPKGTVRLRERIWNPEVRIHGPIATVWAPYDFWKDGVLSHCGIDAFDLVKGEDGWRIAGGVYTKESTCGTSPLGPLK